MNAIELINLSKKYKEAEVVKEINLTIRQGELFALLGVNGAGKTTTIKMLSGLTRPSEGDGVILGESIQSENSTIKSKINLSPQETAIAPNLSVRENIEFICRLYGSKKEVAKDKTLSCLEELGLTPIADKSAKTLSGGWQRRLSIAMAFISNPEILFLDEPTLGLDVLARRELWKLIVKLKKNTTVILTTHYLEEAQELADRVGIMSDGNLIAVGTPGELMKQTGTDCLEDAFITICQGGNTK